MPQLESNRPTCITLVAIGTNLPSHVGDPGATARAALEALCAEFGQPRAVSPLYATPCHPAGAGPDYVNAVVALDAQGLPADILSRLHRIEARFDRARHSRWASRSLDLDLLAMGSDILPDRDTFWRWHDLPPERQATETPDQLVLPHPRLQDRAFVLVPLAGIVPDWRHPVLGRTAVEMRDALPLAARRGIVPLDV